MTHRGSSSRSAAPAQKRNAGGPPTGEPPGRRMVTQGILTASGAPVRAVAPGVLAYDTSEGSQETSMNQTPPLESSPGNVEATASTSQHSASQSQINITVQQARGESPVPQQLHAAFEAGTAAATNAVGAAAAVVVEQRTQYVVSEAQREISRTRCAAGRTVAAAHMAHQEVQANSQIQYHQMAQLLEQNRVLMQNQQFLEQVLHEERTSRLPPTLPASQVSTSAALDDRQVPYDVPPSLPTIGDSSGLVPFGHPNWSRVSQQDVAMIPPGAPLVPPSPPPGLDPISDPAASRSAGQEWSMTVPYLDTSNSLATTAVAPLATATVARA